MADISPHDQRILKRTKRSDERRMKLKDEMKRRREERLVEGHHISGPSISMTFPFLCHRSSFLSRDPFCNMTRDPMKGWRDNSRDERLATNLLSLSFPSLSYSYFIFSFSINNFSFLSYWSLNYKREQEIVNSPQLPSTHHQLWNTN